MKGDVTEAAKAILEMMELNNDELKEIATTQVRAIANENKIDLAIKWAATQDRNITPEEIMETALKFSMLEIAGRGTRKILKAIIEAASISLQTER